SHISSTSILLSTLPLLPISLSSPLPPPPRSTLFPYTTLFRSRRSSLLSSACQTQVSNQRNRRSIIAALHGDDAAPVALVRHLRLDRKSTRLNSSHLGISYAVFCLKKKKKSEIMRSQFSSSIMA